MGSIINRLLDPVLRSLRRHRRVLLGMVVVSAAVGAAVFQLVTAPVEAVVTIRAEQGVGDVVGVLSDQAQGTLSRELLAQFEVLLDARRQGDPLYPRWRQARQLWQTAGSDDAWAYLDETLTEASARARAFGERLEDDADAATRSREFAERIRVRAADGSTAGVSAWQIEFASDHASEPSSLIRLLVDLVQDHAERSWMGRMTANEAVASARLEGCRARRVAVAEAAMERLIDTELPSPSDVLLLEPLEGAPLAEERAAMGALEEERNRLAGEWSATASLHDEVMDQFPAALRPGVGLSARRPAGIAFASGSKRRSMPPRDDAADEVPLPDLERLAERLSGESAPLSAVKSVAVPEALMRANPMLSRLKQREAELATRLNLLKGEYPDQPGWMSGVERELLETRRTLLLELLGEARALRVRTEGLTRRLDEVGTACDRAAERVATLAGLRPRYRQLAGELEDARRQAAVLSGELGALREARGRGEQRPVVRVTQGPELRRGEHVSALVAGVAAGLAALLIGMAAALLAERHTQRLSASGVTAAIRSTAAPAVIEIPVLGRVRWCEGGPIEEGG